jgi:hypothetical protein
MNELRTRQESQIPRWFRTKNGCVSGESDSDNEIHFRDVFYFLFALVKYILLFIYNNNLLSGYPYQ